MKAIYRLPYILLVIVCGAIIYDIYAKVRAANADGFFEMIKYGDPVIGGNPDAVIMGISAYNFLMIVGLICAVILAVLRRKSLDFKGWTAAVIAVAFFLQAYMGAKVLFGIEQVLNEKSLSAFTMDGQSLYGTIPSTFLFVLIVALITKRKYGHLLDYLAPLWLTLLVFVRTGCFTVGCCGADPCVFAGAEIILPVQLIEVACDLILLVVIFGIEKKGERKGGHAFFVMMAGYGIYRIFLELLRNTPVVFLGLTYGQLYAMIFIIIAIVCIYVQSSKRTAVTK